jgi:4-amino-4-deoxy-L-arabinose transferase-like glycosyltransferase
MKHLYFFPILLVPCFLSLCNLGRQDFWQDEAQTACISRTILTGGLPRGYDGKNYFSQELSAEYGKDYIWKWHTWLPFYITAASFKLFGTSTFSARVPFVLCGILTVLLVFYTAAAFFPNRHARWLAMVLMSFCVPFLILSRQCRYYSMAALFFTAALYAYVLLLQQKRGSGVFLVVSLTLLFQTQYIYFFILTAAIVFHVSVFERARLKPLFLVVLAAALINLPWMLWLSGMRYADQYGSQAASFPRIFSFTFDYGQQCIKLALFPFVFVVPILYVAIRRMRSGLWPHPSTRTVSAFTLLALSIGLNIAVLAIASPQPFARYLAPLIPAMVIVVAYFLSLMLEVHWLVCILATVAVIAQWPVIPFLHEVRHPVCGPVQGIVAYLKAHGAPDDTVAITYEDMPLKFYTTMRVVGGLTGEDLSPALSARWVVFRKRATCEKESVVLRYLIAHLDPDRFRRIAIDSLDTPIENSGELSGHLSSITAVEDKFVIYERVQ